MVSPFQLLLSFQLRRSKQINSITGRGTVYHRVKIGDEDTITVYRTSKGKYKIEPIDSPIEILIATIGSVLCIFILVAMTVGRILEKRDKEKNEESDNKGKKSKRK